MYHFAAIVPVPWLKIFVNNEGNVLKSALGWCKTFFTVTYQPEKSQKKSPATGASISFYSTYTWTIQPKRSAVSPVRISVSAFSIDGAKVRVSLDGRW